MAQSEIRDWNPDEKLEPLNLTSKPKLDSKNIRIPQKIQFVVDVDIDTEDRKAREKFGYFNSPQELYGVLAEEVHEFFLSMIANEPDINELIDIAVTARAGAMWLLALKEIKEKGEE